LTASRDGERRVSRNKGDADELVARRENYHPASFAEVVVATAIGVGRCERPARMCLPTRLLPPPESDEQICLQGGAHAGSEPKNRGVHIDRRCRTVATGVEVVPASAAASVAGGQASPPVLRRSGSGLPASWPAVYGRSRPEPRVCRDAIAPPVSAPLPDAGR